MRGFCKNLKTEVISILPNPNMANLKASLSQDELGKLVKLIKLIDSNKLLNEIDKLMFNNESTFVRFLMSANYNHEVAFE